MKKIIYFSIITFSIIVNTSCSKESDVRTKLILSQNTLNAPLADSHHIGEHFGGGIVFFIEKAGKHGLIAAFSDPEEPAAWSLKDTINGAKATVIGKGYLNTTRIFETQGAPQSEATDYAASDCLIYQANGYQDWYMPSKDELNELYKQKNIVGNFQPYAYWSSSEANKSKAWLQIFGTGVQATQIKKASYAVRPIRRF